jgi:hypothetical protein
LDGAHHSRPSIYSAAKSLGTSISTITRHCNYAQPHYLNSPIFGLVIVHVANRGILPHYIPATEGSPLSVDIASLNLQPDMCYLLDENYELITNLGPFKNATDINLVLGVPQSMRLRRYLNIEHLIQAPALGSSVYIIKHAVKVLGTNLAPVSYVVTNLTTGITTTVEHAASVAEIIYGTRRTFTPQIIRFVLPGEIITYRGVSYRVTFLNSVDRERFEAKFGPVASPQE